ncbi:MAG TPA: FRG domain-containing protein [Thermomicrobiales bacterium]|nr:FRG domain-containing protein [Thermomicrobiales bacterium]
MLPAVATGKGSAGAAKAKKATAKKAPARKGDSKGAGGKSSNGAAGSTAEVKSVAELVEALSARPDKEIVWYRGHNDANHPLIPSLARPPKSVDAEMTLVKRFRQNAYPFLEMSPRTEWDWLFLMQHHGVPTRLLDWSDSPLVALWFAMQGGSDQDDACIWALQPVELNKLANLDPDFAADIPLFGQDKELDSYLPTQLPATIASLKPIAGIASRQFTRVVAQMGSFTITHKEQPPLQDVADGCLTQYVVPAGSKKGIRKELRYLRMTTLSVFPELANVKELAEEGLW